MMDTQTAIKIMLEVARHIPVSMKPEDMAKYVEAFNTLEHVVLSGQAASTPEERADEDA